MHQAAEKHCAFLRRWNERENIYLGCAVGAVLTFRAALRAKAILVRKLRQASNLLLHPTGRTRPAAE